MKSANPGIHTEGTDPPDVVLVTVPQAAEGLGALLEELPQGEAQVGLVAPVELRGHLGGPHQHRAAGRQLPGGVGQTRAAACRLYLLLLGGDNTLSA